MKKKKEISSVTSELAQDKNYQHFNYFEKLYIDVCRCS